jgi:hypothetical protein
VVVVFVHHRHSRNLENFCPLQVPDDFEVPIRGTKTLAPCQGCALKRCKVPGRVNGNAKHVFWWPPAATKLSNGAVGHRAPDLKVAGERLDDRRNGGFAQGRANVDACGRLLVPGKQEVLVVVVFGVKEAPHALQKAGDVEEASFGAATGARDHL